MLPVRITGTGIYAPGAPIDNTELKRLSGVDFDALKLEGKLGIRQRHLARLRGLDESTADFATAAARMALEDAGLAPEALDLIIVGTDTPEYISPATAMLVQGRLQGGETRATAFDIGVSCASFCIALDTAARILATRDAPCRALVVGVYNMPAYVRPDDAFGLSIFADGAGALILEKSENGPSAYLAGQHLTDGTQWDYIGVYAGGTRRPVTAEVLASGAYGLENLQPLPGDRNVRLWPLITAELLAKAGLVPDQVDHFIFTQINRSVIEQVMDILGQPLEKTTLTMDRYGYTGSACVPMAFHTAVREGRIRRGDRVALVASGAGLAVGSNLFIY